ncbi:MAG: phosphatase PAP2 family protein [Hydrogenophaga sp.]|jgi:undecaprenyl-diphosphatase|uniref:phosphatase PAP2 family protein n=1 Tax=Hydrogenophaga sp. TaxID=1904254 RepID=UPI0027231C44|nr:phosphatase PAP2 family protein [Hydrogenophaga sp.]MDO9481523.1 phosphatase PAP2 family protein [Hydrogenophaga sp.]MDO9567768.1 phosphatase PAP2 family protein [Hydrogenophaga sp.]MDP2220470.1 phosphatase PAP2 family protein [Hydrogenophaga sp.]MDP3344733.1 phosphatase PAP2 family protein [Hydrogenophaga sp.]MDP3375496.1 phosphatase PAP2 family protein [Hydrogenophaga sp.]
MQTLEQPTPTVAPLSRWQRLDRRLFAWLGAGHRPQPIALAVAKAVARWSWVPLVGLMLSVGQNNGAGLWVLAQCLLAAGLVQVASKRLSRRMGFGRPFMEGLSPNHLQHSHRSGFPSTHATVMGTVFGFMLLHMPSSPALAGMAAILVATGWARVYVGAHFPLDVLAGLALGCVCGTFFAAALLV